MSDTKIWEETCGCGATLRLNGWGTYPDSPNNAETVASTWRKEHKCQQNNERIDELRHKFNRQDIWMEHFQTRLNDLHERLSKMEGADDG